MNTRKRTPASVATADKGRQKHFDNVSMDILAGNYQIIKGKSLWIRTEEIMSLLEVSRSTAQRLIRRINTKLEAAGKFCIQGATNRAAFYAEVGYMGIDIEEGEKDG